MEGLASPGLGSLGVSRKISVPRGRNINISRGSGKCHINICSVNSAIRRLVGEFTELDWILERGSILSFCFSFQWPMCVDCIRLCFVLFCFVLSCLDWKQLGVDIRVKSVTVGAIAHCGYITHYFKLLKHWTGAQSFTAQQHSRTAAQQHS